MQKIGSNFNLCPDIKYTFHCRDLNEGPLEKKTAFGEYPLYGISPTSVKKYEEHG
jgi:hypothetical protein